MGKNWAADHAERKPIQASPDQKDLLDLRLPVFGRDGKNPQVVQHLDLAAAVGVAEFAELARLGLVSRARMTQIISLLHLAPDIQEQVLFLRGTSRGQDAVTERHLRPLTMELDWEAQRVKWGRVVRRVLWGGGARR